MTTLGYPSPPRIVRETLEVDYAQYRRLGAAGMKEIQDGLLRKALRIAKDQLGIIRPHVTTMWCLATHGDDTYPMYLCGPDAPRSDTPESIFANVWHLENPWAQYTVVVRDQDYLDALDRAAKVEADKP